MSKPLGPPRLVAVLGTGTEVGKTWVACRLIAELLARGNAVAARKPAQSFQPGAGPTDAELLAAATRESPDRVCPPHRWYETALAPPMAAAALGQASFTTAELAAESTWPTDVGWRLVEGAGGVRSPIAADGDNLDLAVHLQPHEVVLVADAELGTINSVRLAADAIVAAGLCSPIVYLNRFDGDREVHRRNRDWLVDVDHMKVVTDPIAAVGVLAHACSEPRPTRPGGPARLAR